MILEFTTEVEACPISPPKGTTQFVILKPVNKELGVSSFTATLDDPKLFTQFTSRKSVKITIEVEEVK